VTPRPRLTIGVTGLNATDNPGPGVAVLRSLRASARPVERLVGLTYDALDPGLYTEGLADASYLLTYPSAGTEACLQRLRQVHEKVGLDVIVPTLDAELPLFMALGPQLREMGIAVLLPTEPQLSQRGKAGLAALGQAAGLDVPATAIIGSADELKHVHAQVPYPFFVKGPFYGATRVGSYEEAVVAYYRALATWGGPVIVQALVHGEEVNVVGVGDGDGGMWGAVAMKKLALTDKGKGWAGVTIDDRRLLALAEKFVSFTRWPGPFEAEVIRSNDGRYHLIEINPRFPAWVHLATGAGVNLPRAVVELARGNRPSRPKPYAVGKMFVRISIDQIVDMSDFASLATTGEIAGVQQTSL
jgi:carbamoyl-phosphate synthase large subunit